jgi:site-specific DNA-methyltransferase (cytosine-N4-specific)
VKARLDTVDWDFPGSTTIENSVHALHWFPGNFIPQIPSFLIQCLSEPGQVVADPFCGSGTTITEAIALRRRAYGLDANRVSVLISKAKCALALGRGLKDILHSVAGAIVWPLGSRLITAGTNEEGTDSELEAWYHPDTLSQLRGIWDTIQLPEYRPARPILHMLFSDTLFSCVSSASSGASRPGRKRRRHHWGWIADNVKPSSLIWRDARFNYLSRLERAFSICVEQGAARTSVEFPPLICHGTAIALPWADESIDVVVTSPPYLSMIDYARANRLTYLWFKWCLPADREMEIGARYRRGRKAALADYLESIELAACEITRVLRRGGYCAIVIGSSRRYTEAAPAVIRSFERKLRQVWGPIGRTPSRRRISDRQGSETREFLCVFRKE